MIFKVKFTIVYLGFYEATQTFENRTIIFN